MVNWAFLCTCLTQDSNLNPEDPKKLICFGSPGRTVEFKIESEYVWRDIP